jgi:polyisoprenoid-binding protein YceI
MSNLPKSIGLFIGLFTALFVSNLRAAEFNSVLQDKSAIAFIFKQMNVPVEGGFKKFNSKLNFDPAKPTLAKVEINIEIAGIDAGSDEANDMVADKLWFNTKAFPVAHFVSTSVKSLGSNRFEVAGKMSIKGRTLEVIAPATFRQEGANGVFEGGFTLNRADYGLGEGSWADFGAVANQVQIKFRLVASVTASKR